MSRLKDSPRGCEAPCPRRSHVMTRKPASARTSTCSSKEWWSRAAPWVSRTAGSLGLPVDHRWILEPSRSKDVSRPGIGFSSVPADSLDIILTMKASNVKKSSRGRGRPPLSQEARHGRAQRILDAAAGLVLERGYDAVSMDDVAQAVGVAKGTLYEHWPNRDELFLTLVHREQDSLATQVTSASPKTVQDLMRETALALLQRPLLVAVLVENSEVWGKQLDRLSPSSIYQSRIASFVEFLTALRERGQVRTDQSISEQIHIVTGVLAGFLMARALIPPTLNIEDSVLAEVMADTAALALGSTGADLPAPAATRLLNAGRDERTRSEA